MFVEEHTYESVEESVCSNQGNYVDLKFVVDNEESVGVVNFVHSMTNEIEEEVTKTKLEWRNTTTLSGHTIEYGVAEESGVER
jgi:uncharacterized protein YfcZ (UPF0381/DUF406 family)